MMSTFVITFFVLLAVIIAMSVGVLTGRKPIKGSCGGVGAALNEPDYICDVCGNDPNKCEEQQGGNASRPEPLAYEATRK